MSKVICECGTELLKTSLRAHLLTEKHKKLLAAKSETKSETKVKEKLSKEQAKEILTSAIRFRIARQEYSFLQKKEEIKKLNKIVKENSKRVFAIQSDVQNYERLNISSSVLNKLFQSYKIKGEEQLLIAKEIEKYLLDDDTEINNELIYSILEVSKGITIKDFDEFMDVFSFESDNFLNIINYFIKYIEYEIVYPAKVEYGIMERVKEFYDYGIEKESIKDDLERIVKYFNLKMDYTDTSFNNFKKIFKACYDKFKQRYLNTDMRIKLLQNLIEEIQNDKLVVKVEELEDIYEKLQIDVDELIEIYENYEITDEKEQIEMTNIIKQNLLDEHYKLSNEYVFDMLKVNSDINFSEFMDIESFKSDIFLNIINYFIKFIHYGLAYPKDTPKNITKSKIKSFYDYHNENNIFKFDTVEETIQNDLKRIVKYFDLEMDYTDTSFNNYKNIIKASYDKFKDLYLNGDMRMNLIKIIIEYKKLSEE